MTTKLPARPNLEHLRTQAKALLTKLLAGDKEAAQAFIKHLPAAARFTPARVRQHGFRLADAQAVIARQSGFGQWPALARHVERLRSMEGAWTFRSLEVDGQNMPASVIGDSKILIDADRFRSEMGDATFEGVFTIDVEATPPRIDIDFVEGPEAGNRSEGIFELNGDELRICLGLVGSSRPDRFLTKKGSGHALEQLVRSEHARPVGVDGGTPAVTESKPVSVAADPGNFDGSITPTLARLQGEWLPLELITSGKPLEAAYLPYGYRTHALDETKVVFGGQTMAHAKIRFNESAEPLEVDYLNLAGKSKGSLSLGLFRWDGDEAVFCMGALGSPRPSDFTCAKGSDRILSRWKRKG
jgi:uncharacterized protein (TIGR03067 family)